MESRAKLKTKNDIKSGQSIVAFAMRDACPANPLLKKDSKDPTVARASCPPDRADSKYKDLI